MILDQLVEKKDLFIYINLRIKHLQNLIEDESVKFHIHRYHEDYELPPLSNRELKKLDKCIRRWKSQIVELQRLKTLLSQNTLKKMGKIYWKQQNQKV